jgi:asparagine synthase (glutamine-hydrolysing)
MCGIAGFVDFEGHEPHAARVRVERMARMLSHRGPDEEGVFVDTYAALGHRRLAIIDVSSGHQPLAACDGQVQIVFNGEIYNYLNVRAELTRAGHVFTTTSDTEVIVEAYSEWGEQCVERLHGMFAFAIWDARSRRLVLARDRVGKKPLYVYREGTTVAFASELKALRAGGLCTDEVDAESLDCYLTLGYVPAPRTIYRRVTKILPAHVVTATADGQRERRYWQLSFAHETRQSSSEIGEELEALLDDAVRCRLMSEVPLGAFLSGGLDSSLVVATMSQLLDAPVKTHSIGFDDAASSELGAARAIAAHLGTEHREFIVRPRAAEVLPKIAWHFDEPVADSSALPTWYVCEMTRQSVTVALSGDGGDEVFGGYTFRYLPHMYESKLRAALPPVLRGVLFGPLGAVWPGSARLPKPLRLKTIFENLALGDAEAFYRDLAWLRDDVRERLYRPEFLRGLNGFTAFEPVHSLYAHSDAADALGRAQFTDVHVYMADDVLPKVDRMSMAHSLEVRSPLLDHRMLELGARLPAAQKIDRRKGKLPLRALAARRLPEWIHRLPKQGFSIPAARWLREDLRPFVEESLASPGSVVEAHLDVGTLRELWRQHLKGARDHSVLLWAVVMLKLWEQSAVRLAA